MSHRIYPLTIPTHPGESEVRWFLDVQTADGRWHDVGNSTERGEMYELLTRIEIVGNSWRERGIASR